MVLGEGGGYSPLLDLVSLQQCLVDRKVLGDQTGVSIMHGNLNSYILPGLMILCFTISEGFGEQIN